MNVDTHTYTHTHTLSLSLSLMCACANNTDTRAKDPTFQHLAHWGIFLFSKAKEVIFECVCLFVLHPPVVSVAQSEGPLVYLCASIIFLEGGMLLCGIAG